MKSGFEKLIRFATGDRGLTLFLGLLVVLMFVLTPMAAPHVHRQLMVEIFFSLVLIVGALTSLERRWTRLVIPPLIIVALSVRWTSFATGAGLVIWREIAGEISVLLSLALFVYVLASRIYRQGPITSHRIHGAIAVYLLLGLAWASVYELLYRLNPHAFSGPLGDEPSARVWIYYSVATLTTVGYGDIAPLDPMARSASVLEALTGQLFLAITIARLVASQKAHGDEG